MRRVRLLFLVVPWLSSVGGAALAESYVATLLDPGGVIRSTAAGIFGSNQVGFSDLSNTTSHALLWHGTASSVVDLNPSDLYLSEAAASTDSYQVGSGHLISLVGTSHALMWAGTAASIVDLNPAGFQYSRAEGISGTTQVGFAENLAISSERQRIPLGPHNSTREDYANGPMAPFRALSHPGIYLWACILCNRVRRDDHLFPCWHD